MSENEMNEMNIQPTAFEESVLAKPQSKKGLFIGIAALVAVAIIAAIVIGVMANTPMGLLATGFRNSIKALESNSDMDILNEISNGGSMEISMDLAALMQDSGIPLSGTASVKVYADNEKGKSVVSMGVLLGGVQNLDATIYADRESVILASDFLLGNKAYGFDLEGLEKDFNNSVFGPEGPFSLGIELPENFQELLEKYRGQMEKYQDYNEATQRLSEQMVSRLLESLEKNADIEKENDILTLNDEDVKTIAVSIKMDHDQLAEIIEDMLEYLRTDEDLEAYLEEYADILFGTPGMDSSDTVEQFYDALDEAEDNFDEMKDEMEEQDAGLKITFHITKSGKQLIGMELELQGNTDPVILSIYAGPDLADMKEVSFRVDSEESSVRGEYVITENDKKEFAAQLKVQDNGESVLSGQVTWNKQDGDFAVTLTNVEGDVVALRGTLEQSEKETSLVLQSVEVEGQQTNLGIGIKLLASDKMPDTPQHTDILKMTQAEVEALVQELSMALLPLTMGMMQQ